MAEREYYSIREGRKQNEVKFDLPLLLELFFPLYKDFEKKMYFSEAFGFGSSNSLSMWPLDNKFDQGIETYLLRKVYKKNLWPIEERYKSYSEDDLFDVIEFLYDCVSKPSRTTGGLRLMAFKEEYRFDREVARHEFRTEINKLLADYKDGYMLSEVGEVLVLPDSGLENLLEAQLPEYDPENVEDRVNAAILKFRRYRSSMEDRRDAVRDLADVLEFLKKEIKQVITKKDESDLFHIANRFGIRHHNEKQKMDYDKRIWYSWMFYYYLATIHASLRLIKKYEQNDIESASD